MTQTAFAYAEVAGQWCVVRRKPKRASRSATVRVVKSTLPPAETWAEPPVPRGPEPVTVPVVLTLGRDWARQWRLYAIARAAEAARRTTT